MISREIVFFDHSVTVSCDALCNKAWGIATRPKVFIQGEDIDPDDYYFLADSELVLAPTNPGTYEGGHAKPTRPEDRLNKWCVRQCERCGMYGGLRDYPAPDLTTRHYNKAQ